MKRKFFYALAAFTAAFALMSCNEVIPEDNGGDDTPQATVPDEVLFSIADNGDGYFIVDPDMTEPVQVVLIRPAGGKEVTYNLTSSSAEVLTIPSSVTFAEGATQATIEIGLPEKLEPKKRYDIELVLTGDNVAESASSLGSVRYEAAIYTYEEALMKSYFSKDYYVSEYDPRFIYFGYFKTIFWILPDNMIIWKNFLGSGNDIRLTFSDTVNDSYRDLTKIVMPSEMELYGDEPCEYDWGGLYCYLGHYEGGVWNGTDFYPKGQDKYIDAIDLIYGTYNYSLAGITESNSYFYINSDITFGDGSEYEYVILNLVRVESWDDGTDYENYPEKPEIVIPDYPEAAEIEPQEGHAPLCCYVTEWDDETQEYVTTLNFDDQDGVVSTDKNGQNVLTISNYLNSGKTATFTQIDDKGTVKINIDGGYTYTSEGTDYYYDDRTYQPWKSSADWTFSGLCYIPIYCTGYISEDYISVSLYGGFDLYYLYSVGDIQEEIPIKDGVWYSYLNFYYQNPNVEIPDYPEAAGVTPKEGNLPLDCYIWEGHDWDDATNDYLTEEKITFDSQEGTISTDSDGNPVLTISNFLNSGKAAKFTQTSDRWNVKIELESGYTDDYGYYDDYENCYYPWASDYDWCACYFAFYTAGGTSYCYGYISEDYVCISLTGYYYLYYGNIAVKNSSWGSLCIEYDPETEEAE